MCVTVTPGAYMLTSWWIAIEPLLPSLEPVRQRLFVLSSIEKCLSWYPGLRPFLSGWI